MAEIAQANDILSDRKKKAIYDQYGSKVAKKNSIRRFCNLDIDQPGS